MGSIEGRGLMDLRDLKQGEKTDQKTPGRVGVLQDTYFNGDFLTEPRFDTVFSIPSKPFLGFKGVEEGRTSACRWRSPVPKEMR